MSLKIKGLARYIERLLQLQSESRQDDEVSSYNMLLSLGVLRYGIIGNWVARKKAEESKAIAVAVIA